MIDSIRSVERSLGSFVKAPTASELSIRGLVRRSVTALRDLEVGSVIESDHVTLQRPGTGIPPCDMELVIGRQVQRKLAAGDIISWSDLI